MPHRITPRRLDTRASRGQLTFEALEIRLAPSSQSVVASGGLVPAVYPDGLNHVAPAVRAAIAAVTTTAPSDAFFKLTDLEPLTPTEGAGPGTSLVESTDLIGLAEFRNDPRFAGIDGRGFSVVILDTGIDSDHPFFGPDTNSDGVADRIVYQYDYIDNDPIANDDDGHGTHVTSIAASQDAAFPGMAPGANIIHLKVLDAFGAGTAAGIEAALQWVVANVSTYNIASVNMSFAHGDNLSSPATYPDLGLSDELAAIAAQNVIIASASGNSFFEFRSAPGVDYPSADPNSLSIGAVWDSNVGGPFNWSDGASDITTGADRIVSFSQRHPTMTTVFAPGAPITAAARGGGTAQLSGTSMSSPIVAGIAALAQQLAAIPANGRLSMAEFKELLNETGDPIFDGDDENDNVTNTQQHYHRVDVLALANSIVSGGLSDLSIPGGISLQSPTVPTGGVVRASFTIANQGSTPSGNFQGKLYLSTDPIITASDRFLGDLANNLLPGQSNARINYGVDVPGDVTPGAYYLGLLLDSPSVVAEGNEGNNVAVASVTVTAVAAEIWLSEVGGTTVVSGVSAFNFGEVDQGQANVVKTFRIANDGSALLTLANLELPTGFIATGFPASVGAHSSVDFTIALDATRPPAAYSGFISFNTNDSNEGAFAISLSGIVNVRDEQGNNAATAAQVSVPVDVESKIQSGGDVDWFRFNAVAGSPYRMEVILGTLADSVLRVIGVNGTTQLAEADNGGVGLGSLLAWQAPTDGAYFVEVRGKGVQPGTYRLKVTTGDDHGNTGATATPTSDPSENQGVIETLGDVDWFSFSAGQGVTYRIETALSTLGNSALRLYHSDRTTQIAFNDDGPGVAPASLIEWTSGQAGTYYIAVEASSPTMIGSYALSITGVDDHGNGSSRATSVLVPVSQPGIVDTALDEDWFAFNAVGGAEYEIETQFGTLTGSQLWLIGVDGATVLASTEVVGPGDGPSITWTAPANGRYYLIVNGVAGSTGSYDLRIAVTDDHGDTAFDATKVDDPSIHSGRLESTSDHDWFSIQMFAGVTYRFETKVGSLPGASMRLMANNGLALVVATPASPGHSSVIEWTALSNAVRYIEISTATGQVGDYQLQIIGDDDHGDDFQNAGPLTIGLPANGDIERNGDLDWFSIATIAGVNYRLEFELQTLPGATIRVFEDDGVTEVPMSVSQIEPKTLVEWTATYKGVYYIEVGGTALPATSQAGASSEELEEDRTGSYRLTPLIASAIPGDYDGNGNVGGLDFLAWQRSRGSGAAPTSVPLNSGGFEAYNSGPLTSNLQWKQLGPDAGSAVVQSSVVESGQNALRVDRAAGVASGPIPNNWWGVPLGAAAATGPVVLVQWDMRVTATGAQNGALGPFFGVQAYDDTGVFGLIGSLGVDATTLDVLYQTQDDGYFVDAGVRVAPDIWYNFAVLFDFARDEYTIYFEGSAIATTGFVDRGLGLDQLTDADIAAIAVQGDAASQAIPGTAYFDNFRIVNGVPGGFFPTDGNGDGTVDNLDLQVWKDHFGIKTNGGAGAATGASTNAVQSSSPVASVAEVALTPPSDYSSLAQWVGNSTLNAPSSIRAPWSPGNSRAIALQESRDLAHAALLSPSSAEVVDSSAPGYALSGQEPVAAVDAGGDDEFDSAEGEIDAALAELFA